MERIHECINIDNNIHMLFQEQAVCKRGTKIEKVSLDEYR